MFASEIILHDAATVRPDASVAELSTLPTSQDISAAPVIVGDRAPWRRAVELRAAAPDRTSRWALMTWNNAISGSASYSWLPDAKSQGDFL